MLTSAKSGKKLRPQPEYLSLSIVFVGAIVNLENNNNRNRLALVLQFGFKFTSEMAVPSYRSRLHRALAGSLQVPKIVWFDVTFFTFSRKEKI